MDERKYMTMWWKLKEILKAEMELAGNSKDYYIRMSNIGLRVDRQYMDNRANDECTREYTLDFVLQLMASVSEDVEQAIKEGIATINEEEEFPF